MRSQKIGLGSGAHTLNKNNSPASPENPIAQTNKHILILEKSSAKSQNREMVASSSKDPEDIREDKRLTSRIANHKFSTNNVQQGMVAKLTLLQHNKRTELNDKYLPRVLKKAYSKRKLEILRPQLVEVSLATGPSPVSGSASQKKMIESAHVKRYSSEYRKQADQVLKKLEACQILGIAPENKIFSILDVASCIEKSHDTIHSWLKARRSRGNDWVPPPDSFTPDQRNTLNNYLDSCLDWHLREILACASTAQQPMGPPLQDQENLSHDSKNAGLE